VKNEIKTLLLKCQKKQKNKKTMPLASLIPSIITGGASLLGGVLNAGSQMGTNSSQLSYAKEMYDKQRADALTDWNMQNEYNSPKQQMTRFKEAGLNPNLIYGQMSNSPVVRTSSPQTYNPTAPQVDLAQSAGMALNSYYDTQLKTAQTDAVKAQADSAKQDVLLKSLDVMKKTADIPYLQDIAKSNANKAITDAGASYYDLTENAPKRTELLKLQIQGQNSINKQTDANIIKIKQDIENLKKSGDLLEFEKKLKAYQVDNQDINNIVNLVTKVLGLVPGIGGLFK